MAGTSERDKLTLVGILVASPADGTLWLTDNSGTHSARCSVLCEIL